MSHHEYFPVHCMATVFPVPSSEFDPRKDSEQLREAMKNTVLKGIGVDKQTIIDILTTRGCVQRLAIAQSFKTMYGKDITEAFRSTLTGDFQRLVTALMAPLDELYAQELHWAMSGPGTSEKTLIEILCTLSNGGIRYVASAYERLYKMALEDHLKRNTSFYFKRLLVSLSQGNRDETSTVDQGQVEKDAEDLYKAGVARWGTDETVFNAIMAFRSYPHLKEVFRKYADIAGHDIVDAINNEFSGDIKDAHLTIVQCVRNKSVFFAQRLHWSMKGLGTDERTLIRIVVARSEIDLGDIKQQFEEMYQGRLEDWIKDDTSGHFQKALLKLIDCA